MEYIKKIPLWIMMTFILSLVVSSMAFTKEAITKDPGVTVRILAKGAPIHGANGVMFDSKDRLYIASVFGNEIIVMDPRSGTILQGSAPTSLWLKPRTTSLSALKVHPMRAIFTGRPL